MTQRPNHERSRERESGKVAGSDDPGKYSVGRNDGLDVVRRRFWLLAEYRPKLVAVAIGSGLDRAQAEDVAHDALIKTALSATELADDELPKYAAKAVRNLAVNLHRDTATRTGIVENASLRPDEERFDERVLVKIIASDLLTHMSETEPAETVEMLVWWALGYTHAEICEVYGKTKPAVQSRLHRAIKKQRDAMAK